MSLDDSVNHEVNFVDYFKYFEENRWRKDRSWRHCGGTGCMVARADNLQYFSHENNSPLLQNELTIRMQNDCRENFCCTNEKRCTDYTSGQITSRDEYSHGSFTFTFQITEESKDYIWTCFDRFDYVAGDTIQQSDFPLTIEPDEVVQRCKNICLNRYQECIGFWYQRHPTIQVCNWQRSWGTTENTQKKGGLVCRLKRAMKNSKRPKPGKGDSESEAGPSGVKSGEDAYTPYTTVLEELTTPEQFTTVEIAETTSEAVAWQLTPPVSPLPLAPDTTIEAEDHDVEEVPELDMEASVTPREIPLGSELTNSTLNPSLSLENPNDPSTVPESSSSGSTPDMMRPSISDLAPRVSEDEAANLPSFPETDEDSSDIEYPPPPGNTPAERNTPVEGLTAQSILSLNISSAESSSDIVEEEMDDDNPPPLEEAPCDSVPGSHSLGWYTAVLRTRVRDNETLAESKEVMVLEKGLPIRVVEIRGRRARIDWPLAGWVSICKENGEVIFKRKDRNKVNTVGEPSDPGTLDEQYWMNEEDEWEKEYDSDRSSTIAPESNTHLVPDESSIGEGEVSEGDHNGSSSEYTSTQPTHGADSGSTSGYTSTQPSQKPSALETHGNPSEIADQFYWEKTHRKHIGNHEENGSNSQVEDTASSSNSIPTLEQEGHDTTKPAQREWTLGWYRVVMRTRARKNESVISHHVIILPTDTYVRVIQINGRRAKIDWPVKGWVSLYTPEGNLIMVESEHPNVMPEMNSAASSSSSQDNPSGVNVKSDKESQTDGQVHSSTTPEPQTTEQPDTYNGFEDSTTEIPKRSMGDGFRRNGARHCVALTGIAAAGARIMMCIPSWDSRKATIEVREGRNKNSWLKLVDLPFDAAHIVGKFTMEWLPDRIIWRANDNKIAELREGSTPVSIPKQPLHIKIFVAPFKPLSAASSKFIQHSTHMFRARFTKMKALNPDKTELFVLDKSELDYRSLFLGCALLIVVILIFIMSLKVGKRTNSSIGYEKPLLQEDFEGCQVLINS